VTWQDTASVSTLRLPELENQIHRGSYHPQPVKRVLIPKGDGRASVGIPTLEDKNRSASGADVLEPIFGSRVHRVSYGYRLVGRLTMRSMPWPRRLRSRLVLDQISGVLDIIAGRARRVPDELGFQDRLQHHPHRLLNDLVSSVGMPSGRVFPSPFGMRTRFTGCGW